MDRIRQAVLVSIVVCSVCARPQDHPANSPGTRPCILLSPASGISQDVSDADLFRAYDNQVQLVRSLHIIGAMRGIGGATHKVPGKPLELAAIIDLVKPNLLHITGVVPYQGNRAVELASDGQQFGLLVPEDGKKVFLTGPVDAPARSEKAQENLRPRPFIEAMRWEAGTPRPQASPQSSPASNTRTLIVDVAPTEETPTRRVEVDFDLAARVVDSLTAYDSSGRFLLKTLYSDWRTATDPASGAPTECYPRHIVLVEAQQDYKVDLQVNDLTLNAVIPRSSFRVVLPRGIPIQHLDLTGAKGPD
jgi:hypothetical protein